jgi:quinol monooxygenase YgiN
VQTDRCGQVLRAVDEMQTVDDLALPLLNRFYIQLNSTKGEIIMAILLVQHKVKDFAAWKKEFDSAIGLRKSNGELSAQVLRDASDPNSLTIINKWNSLENAQKFAHSPELKAAMEKAGVAGAPNVYFLNEA